MNIAGEHFQDFNSSKVVEIFQKKLEEAEGRQDLEGLQLIGAEEATDGSIGISINLLFPGDVKVQITHWIGEDDCVDVIRLPGTHQERRFRYYGDDICEVLEDGREVAVDNLVKKIALYGIKFSKIVPVAE